MPKLTAPKRASFPPSRHDRLLHDSSHDAYRPSQKYPEPTACPECHAVFHRGRWEWAENEPSDAQAVLCPACRRIQDRFPVGYVYLSGDYFRRHREELLQLVENEAEKERSTHPMERIIERAPEDESTVLTTTGIHLARRLGEALHRACHGELSFHYNDAENLVRVYWYR